MIETSETNPIMQNAYDIVQATAQLRADHKRETSAPQQGIDRLTALVGQPRFVGALVSIIALWIIANLAAPSLGFTPLDPAPFSGLQGAASIAALLMAALILTTQRREDQLAAHRAQLILELTVVNDQKTSKIIELLEEYRRDNPVVANRVDDQAIAMSTPSDTQAVLGAIKEVQEDLA
jgi:uncharacterized membrane protein